MMRSCERAPLISRSRRWRSYVFSTRKLTYSPDASSKYQVPRTLYPGGLRFPATVVQARVFAVVILDIDFYVQCSSLHHRQSLTFAEVTPLLIAGQRRRDQPHNAALFCRLNLVFIGKCNFAFYTYGRSYMQRSGGCLFVDIASGEPCRVQI